jgi:hypothetical protein
MGKIAPYKLEKTYYSKLGRDFYVGTILKWILKKSVLKEQS